MIQTDRYLIVTLDHWRGIVAQAPRSAEIVKPYNVNPCAIFDGRFVVVVATIGM